MTTSPPAPSKESKEWTFRQIVWATLVFVLIGVAFWLVYRFSWVIFVLFVTIVIGTVIRPVVGWLYLHGIPRMAGAILCYCLIFAFVIGFLLLLFPLLAEQSAKISASIPDYYQSFREWLNGQPNPLINQLSRSLPANFSFLGLARQTQAQVLDSAGQAFGYLASTMNAIFMATATILLAFHWTLYGQRAIQSLLLLFPAGPRDSTRELIAAIEAKVSFYIVGQGILCLAIGVMAFIAYSLIGLPNALVLALIAGVLEAVPMIGPLLGAIPAAIVALSISPSTLFWVIVATTVIQQTENTLLVPRVMRRSVGVNPFVSLLAIFAFSSLFGVVGALMAIPIAAITQLLLDRFVFYPETVGMDVSEGRDYASRLRYEAQELAQDLRKQARLKKGETDLSIDEQTDQLMDEIEAIAIDLDSLLAQTSAGADA